MQNPRSLGVLLLFLAMLGTGAWFFLSDRTPDVPTGDTRAASATSVAGEAAPISADTHRSDAEAATRVVAVGDTKTASTPADATGHAFFGKVVDDLGAPVAGAIVRSSPGWGSDDSFDWNDFADFDQQDMAKRWRERRAQGTETTTDVDGRFHLAPPATGNTIELRVLARGHALLDQAVPRPVEVDSDLGVLTLKRGVVLSGRVVDRNGSAVAAAVVTRRDKRSGPDGFDFDFAGVEGDDAYVDDSIAKTDADGHFELPYCAPGDFSLRARHPDHPSATLSGLSAQPGTVMKDVLIVVEPGATLTGRIIGVPKNQKALRVMASSRPVAGSNGSGPGLEVSLSEPMLFDAGFDFGEKSVKTAADFSFTLRGLKVGQSYQLWAAQEGRGFAGNSVCTQRIQVVAGAKGIELRFDAGIEVTFVVVDGKGGAPIERLQVTDQLTGGDNGGMDYFVFAPRGGRSKVYPEGRVTIANLRPKKQQALRLSIEAVGYQSFEKKDIALPATGALDLGTIKLDPSPVLQVTVVSAADQRPVAGATVALQSKSGGGAQNFDFVEMQWGGGRGLASGKTDAEGHCTLNVLTVPMVLSVQSKQFAPFRSEPIELPEGKGGEQRVALLRGGAVIVTAKASDGALLADGSVEHMAPTGFQDSRELDKSGNAQFERLAPGEHRFRIARRDNAREFFVNALPGGTEQPAVDPSWQAVTVVDGGSAALQLTKPPSATLRGIVRENGTPLADARITFVEKAEDSQDAPSAPTRRMLDDMRGGNGPSVQTEQDGTFKLEELPAGLHRLRISAPGRAMSATVQVTLLLGDNELPIDLDVVVLRGVIRDAAGKPIQGAGVSVVPAVPQTATGDARAAEFQRVVSRMDSMRGSTRGQVTTGADGSFELRGVEPGKLVQVHVTAKGYASALSETVEVPRTGSKSGIDVTLAGAGRLTIEMANAPQFARLQATLVGEDGAAVAGSNSVTQMIRRGKATLEGLAPGRWKIVVNNMSAANGPLGDPHFVDVKVGETATLNF